MDDLPGGFLKPTLRDSSQDMSSDVELRCLQSLKDNAPGSFRLQKPEGC